mmetsp:Transcript_29705/g.58948  ORF Transcript_29705/g.58948 Transcript_29705/m.58948 type:complete len:200 (+) Transcript_29705:2314-2913(+)
MPKLGRVFIRNTQNTPNYVPRYMRGKITDKIDLVLIREFLEQPVNKSLNRLSLTRDHCRCKLSKHHLAETAVCLTLALKQVHLNVAFVVRHIMEINRALLLFAIYFTDKCFVVAQHVFIESDRFNICHFGQHPRIRLFPIIGHIDGPHGGVGGIWVSSKLCAVGIKIKIGGWVGEHDFLAHIESGQYVQFDQSKCLYQP